MSPAALPSDYPAGLRRERSAPPDVPVPETPRWGFHIRRDHRVRSRSPDSHCDKLEGHLVNQRFGVPIDVDTICRRSPGHFSPRNSPQASTSPPTSPLRNFKWEGGSRVAGAKCVDALCRVPASGGGLPMEAATRLGEGSCSPRSAAYKARELEPERKSQRRAECARMGSPDIAATSRMRVGECSPRRVESERRGLAAIASPSQLRSSPRVLSPATRASETLRRPGSPHARASSPPGRRPGCRDRSPLAQRNASKRHCASALRCGGRRGSDVWPESKAEVREKSKVEVVAVVEQLTDKRPSASKEPAGVPRAQSPMAKMRPQPLVAPSPVTLPAHACDNVPERIASKGTDSNSGRTPTSPRPMSDAPTGVPDSPSPLTPSLSSPASPATPCFLRPSRNPSAASSAESMDHGAPQMSGSPIVERESVLASPIAVSPQPFPQQQGRGRVSGVAAPRPPLSKPASPRPPIENIDSNLPRERRVMRRSNCTKVGHTSYANDTQASPGSLPSLRDVIAEVALEVETFTAELDSKSPRKNRFPGLRPVLAPKDETPSALRL